MTMEKQHALDRSDVLREMENLSKLLLIRLRSLGDCILTLPLIETLHSWRPELLLDVLVETPFRHVFAHHPSVHELLTLESGNAARISSLAKMKGAAAVRRRNYPAVLNLHGGTSSALFTLASGARWRIGQESFRQRWAYNIRIPLSSQVWQKTQLHTVEHQLTLARWLGIPFEDCAPGRLYIGEEARAGMRDRLVRSGIEPGGYFLIHPTATLFTKQWQEDKFALLADLLTSQYGRPVVFSAAPHEKQVLLRVREHAKAKHVYWSDLALDGLFALVEQCVLFIGNDSGPTHAAAALKKPVVVIWGSSNLHAWYPWNTDSEIIRSDLPCIPCPGYSCAIYGKPKCILDIPVDRVLEACNQIMDRTVHRPPDP